MKKDCLKKNEKMITLEQIGGMVTIVVVAMMIVKG